MNQYYQLLDFGINPLKIGFQLPRSQQNDEEAFVFKPEEILNPELIQFFTKNIVAPMAILVIHQRTAVWKWKQLIHIDGSGEFRLSVNWVFSEKSSMNWYRPLVDYTEKPVAHVQNTRSRRFTEDEVELVDQIFDAGPFLANVSRAPHNGVNLADTDRWSMGVRFPFDKFTSWEMSLKTFEPWFVEERK